MMMVRALPINIRHPNNMLCR